MEQLRCSSLAALFLVLLGRQFDTVITAVTRTTVFSVMSYGARGDGRANDTQAMVDAWNAACAGGGASPRFGSSESISLVLVPGARTFVISSVLLKGPCKSAITLQVSGNLVASSRDWTSNVSRDWIVIKEVSGLNVQGGGVLDGRGQQWWPKSCKFDSSRPCHRAPTTLVLHDTHSVIVDGLTFTNSQQIHFSIYHSTNVTATNLIVYASRTSPNTDGIHIQGSKLVNLANIDIYTGDDCISIGANTSQVLMHDIRCRAGHGISIGSLGNDKSAAFVSNILLDGALLANTTNGVRIKTWLGGSGVVAGIIFRNVQLENVRYPIIIDQYYCDTESSPKGCGDAGRDGRTAGVEVRDVWYDNVTGSSATRVGLKLTCNHPCTDIVLSNIQLTTRNGSHCNAECSRAYGRAYNVTPPSCLIGLPPVPY